ncbi:MAG: DUF2786 domain-containing protein [Deltaproteobacteria bacterium]|nr:DUF2786 domain-containing protein [Deltaproteobacteria bacterium]
MTQPEQQNQIRNTIHRAWLMRLSEEYDDICKTHQLFLCPPVFALCESKDILGQWCPEDRSLKISVRLIETATWSVVLEILRHEIAHQIVSEIFCQKEKGHGPWFRRACQLTGASPAAHKAYISPESLQEELSAPREDDPEEKLLRKVRKLLALASSGNQHEAALALEKAQQLCENFGLGPDLMPEHSQFISLVITHKKKKLELWQKRLSSILIEHFSVRVIQTEIFDAQSLELHKCFDILGVRHKVRIAEYIYWFVANHLPGLWADFSTARQKSGLRSRNQFFQGVVAGLDEQLSKKRKGSSPSAATSSCHGKKDAVVVANKAKLEEFTKLRYPRLQNVWHKSRIRDEDSYEAGKEKGHKLNLYGGIDKTGRQPLRLS